MVCTSGSMLRRRLQSEVGTLSDCVSTASNTAVRVELIKKNRRALKLKLVLIFPDRLFDFTAQFCFEKTRSDSPTDILILPFF